MELSSVIGKGGSVDITNNVKLIVFRDGIDITTISNYHESEYGTEFSTLEEIAINEIRDGYSVLFRDVAFREIDIKLFGNEIINGVKSTFPNKLIELEIHYFWLDGLDQECAKKVVQLDDYFSDIEDDHVKYFASESVTKLINSMNMDSMTFNLNANDPDEDIEEFMPEYEKDDDSDDEDDEDDTEEDDLFAGYHIPNYLRYDDDYSDDDIRQYAKSMLIRLRHAKRNIQRHGIIISNNRHAIKRDAKTLRKMLKEFYGTEKWKRPFIEEILDIIMFRTVISRKEAKRRAKSHRSEYKKKPSISTRDKILGFTRSMLSGGSYDPFYDVKR
jgi:hypothetical protein